MARENIFLRKRSKDIMLALAEKDEWYIYELALKVASTYAHIFNIVKKLQQLGLVETVKKGRKRFIKLTDKGKKLAQLIKEIDELIKS